MTKTLPKPSAVITDLDRLDIRITGARPENEPYVWIGDKRTGLVLDLIDESQMKLLADALLRALGKV